MDFPFPLSTDFLNGLGVVGISVLILMLLIFGKGLALSREVKQRDETIAWQRGTIDEQARQITALSGGAAVSATALHKVSEAAESIASGEGP